MCFYSVQTAFSRLVTSSDTPLLLSANRQPRPAYRVLVRPLALVWTRHRQPSTSTDRATGPISKRGTPHLLTASYIYFLLYCRLLSTPTQVPIATGKQYRVLVRPLDTARQAGMPEAAAAARWPAARCHLLECSGQEGLAAVRNGPGPPGRPRPPTEQDSDASAPGAGAEPCGAPVPLAPPPPPGRGGRYPAGQPTKQGRSVPTLLVVGPVPLGPNRKK